jgi:hypothetical protein
VLADPGTYTYVGNPEWREKFRGSAAHNTVSVDGRDQALASGPFRWTDKPHVEIHNWSSNELQDWLDAAVRYGGIEHRRRVLFLKPGLVFIVDEVSGEGEHLVEQFWHAGGPVRETAGGFEIGPAVLAVSAPAATRAGWRSPAFGMKVPAPVIAVSQTATLPVRLAAMIDVSGWNGASRISVLHADAQAIELQFESRHTGVVRFPRGGKPECKLGVPGGK